MRKNTLPLWGLGGFVVIVLGLIAWLFYYTAQRIDQKKALAESIKVLPNVLINYLDSTEAPIKALASSSIPSWKERRDSSLSHYGERVGDRGILIFYFDPDCEHCQNQAQAIKKKALAFEGLHLVWVSVAGLPKLRQFEKKYGLEKAMPNLKIAHITPEVAFQKFGFSVVPTILIYDNGQHLIKKYVGETKIEALLTPPPIVGKGLGVGVKHYKNEQ